MTKVTYNLVTKVTNKKYARKNLSTLWHKIHLPSQRRYNQMPMRLGATNPRSTPIYRRELHRLPLCELPSRDTKQQTLAKFLIYYNIFLSPTDYTDNTDLF